MKCISLPSLISWWSKGRTPTSLPGSGKLGMDRWNPGTAVTRLVTLKHKWKCGLVMRFKMEGKRFGGTEKITMLLETVFDKRWGNGPTTPLNTLKQTPGNNIPSRSLSYYKQKIMKFGAKGVASWRFRGEKGVWITFRKQTGQWYGQVILVPLYNVTKFFPIKA